MPDSGAGDACEYISRIRLPHEIGAVDAERQRRVNRRAGILRTGYRQREASEVR